MIKYLKWLFSKPEPIDSFDYEVAIQIVLSARTIEGLEVAEKYLDLFERKHGQQEEIKYLRATISQKMAQKRV